MPLAEKLALKLNENNIGYLPINAAVQGASTVHKATRPNQNESFFVATTAVRITPMRLRASRCVAAINGRRGYPKSAPT